MANYLTTITNALTSLIQTQYPRFTNTDRIKLDQKVEFENLGYEDVIVLRPMPTETASNLTSGKIVDYEIDLIYYKKVLINKLANVSDFAESLDNFLLSYIRHSTNWLHLRTEINYDMTDEIPAEYGGQLNGFIMTLTMTRYNPA